MKIITQFSPDVDVNLPRFLFCELQICHLGPNTESFLDDFINSFSGKFIRIFGNLVSNLIHSPSRPLQSIALVSPGDTKSDNKTFFSSIVLLERRLLVEDDRSMTLSNYKTDCDEKLNIKNPFSPAASHGERVLVVCFSWHLTDVFSSSHWSVFSHSPVAADQTWLSYLDRARIVLPQTGFWLLDD